MIKCNGSNVNREIVVSMYMLRENKGADNDCIITHKEFMKLTKERSAIFNVLWRNISKEFDRLIKSGTILE